MRSFFAWLQTTHLMNFMTDQCTSRLIFWLLDDLVGVEVISRYEVDFLQTNSEQIVGWL